MGPTFTAPRLCRALKFAGRAGSTCGTSGGSPSCPFTEFDGWGYAHLYRNEAGKMTRLDSYAVPEALDERFATGFGDLSIHEFATDPEARLAYSSYYAAGFRVLRFSGARGLRETGRSIDEAGTTSGAWSSSPPEKTA